MADVASICWRDWGRLDLASALFYSVVRWEDRRRPQAGHESQLSHGPPSGPLWGDNHHRLQNPSPPWRCQGSELSFQAATTMQVRRWRSFIPSVNMVMKILTVCETSVFISSQISQFLLILIVYIVWLHLNFKFTVLDFGFLLRSIIVLWGFPQCALNKVIVLI